QGDLQGRSAVAALQRPGPDQTLSGAALFAQGLNAIERERDPAALRVRQQPAVGGPVEFDDDAGLALVAAETDLLNPRGAGVADRRGAHAAERQRHGRDAT